MDNYGVVVGIWNSYEGYCGLVACVWDDSYVDYCGKLVSVWDVSVGYCDEVVRV